MREALSEYLLNPFGIDPSFKNECGRQCVIYSFIRLLSFITIKGVSTRICVFLPYHLALWIKEAS